MAKRFAALWFPYLITDRCILRQPGLDHTSFVLASPERGRMVIRAASPKAAAAGIFRGMVVADAKTIFPSLQVFDVKEKSEGELLKALARWSLRYTPCTGIDLPDGLLLDITGCPHLWGGETPYLNDIVTRLNKGGYQVRVASADTLGAAWAVARYGKQNPVIAPGEQLNALLPLPPAALRLEPAVLQRLEKLGLSTIGSFIDMPRPSLRRRFGAAFLSRLDQALGQEIEVPEPVRPVPLYQERLPSLEPVRTAKAIGIALKKLLEMLCLRLEREGNGLRKAVFKGFRVDGDIQQIEIGTHSASRNVHHLFKLFENKIATIRPALGIELFILEAPTVEPISRTQDYLWNGNLASNETALAELIDRIGGKVGAGALQRYLPDEHYWPERSFKPASDLQQKPESNWRTDLPRPLHILPRPEPIEVTVPLPDYPPLLFRYKGVAHRIVRADGPERIEAEWWQEKDLQRDYYCVEDEGGARYWLFRSGHYNCTEPKWFLHGFFA
jgi:protein ImuB